MKVKLTQEFVESDLAPGMYRDSGHPRAQSGFALKVTPAGTKVYLVDSKVRGTRKNVTVTIDKHPTISCKDARDRAKEILALLHQRVNPNELEREEQRKEQNEAAERLDQKRVAELTIRKVFAEYVVSKKLKASTAYVYQCDLFKCLSDWLDKPMSSITKEMVEKRHRKVSEEHEGQANHVMRILRALFYYAMGTYEDREGKPLLTQNPVKRLSQIKAWNKLDRRQDIIDDQDLQAWAKAVLSLRNDAVRDYILLMLFTGLRRDEAAKLEWRNVSTRKRTFTVTDTKNGQSHTLPMSDYLYALFKQREATRTGSYVFPGRVSPHLKDCRAQFAMVTEESEIEFTPHTLRRTFTTIAARMLPDYVVKRLTNHIDGADVTQGYVVVEVEKLREPMRMISEHILTHANLKTAEILESSKVVQLA